MFHSFFIPLPKGFKSIIFEKFSCVYLVLNHLLLEPSWLILIGKICSILCLVCPYFINPPILSTNRRHYWCHILQIIRLFLYIEENHGTQSAFLFLSSVWYLMPSLVIFFFFLSSSKELLESQFSHLSFIRMSFVFCMPHYVFNLWSATFCFWYFISPHECISYYLLLLCMQVRGLWSSSEDHTDDSLEAHHVEGAFVEVLVYVGNLEIV